MDLSNFNEYEKEFLSLSGQLPARINAVLQYTTDEGLAQAEIKRLEGDIMQARQRVRACRRIVPRRGLSGKSSGSTTNVAPLLASLWSPYPARCRRRADQRHAGGGTRALGADPQGAGEQGAYVTAPMGDERQNERVPARYTPAAAPTSYNSPCR